MTNFGSLFEAKKRAQKQSLRDEDVDAIIAAEFSLWFRDNISRDMCQIIIIYEYLGYYITD